MNSFSAFGEVACARLDSDDFHFRLQLFLSLIQSKSDKNLALNVLPTANKFDTEKHLFPYCMVTSCSACVLVLAPQHPVVYLLYMSLAYWSESEQAVEKLGCCAHLIDHTWVFQNLSQVSLILKLCIPTSQAIVQTFKQF